MTTQKLRGFLCLLFLVLQFAAVQSQDLRLKDRDLIITLGNSITEGGEAPEGYVSIMRKVLEVLYPERTIFITNVGISGHKATDMHQRFARDVLQYQPNWVTISVGVNDVWHGFDKEHPQGDGPRGIPLAQFRTEVSVMVQAAQAAGIQVALFTATVIKENLASLENQKLVAYNKALREIAKKYHCLLVDQAAAFREILTPLQTPDMPERGVLTNDGVHMLPAGNWLMAQTALQAWGTPLERIIAIKPRIETMIAQEKEAREKSLARYAEVNYEVGPPRPDEKRVVFLGSSSVDIWNLAQDFPQLSFLNRGIGGETSRQMVQRFRTDVLNLQPTAVVIFLGSGNDFWPDKRMTPAETKSNLIKMTRLAQKQQIKVAIGAISPVNDCLPGKDHISSHPVAVVQNLNAWIKDFCQQQELVFVDFYLPLADSQGKLDARYTDDGMHCNAAGYARWKPVLIQALQALGVWKE